MGFTENGILDLAIDRTPVAVIDFETTGFSARSGDGVVEVSVVRLNPGEEPRLVLDTLVNPEVRVRATSIHGITDEDVVGAPTLSELLGPIANAVSGAVVASYNASFDMGFLEAAFERAPRLDEVPLPPYLCLMYMRPAIGLGERTSLQSALQEAGLPRSYHRAAHDSLASAYLWREYVGFMKAKGYGTFKDLTKGRHYKFTESWVRDPYTRDRALAIGPTAPSTALKPRDSSATYPPPDIELRPRSTVSAADREALSRVRRRATYSQALIDALEDFQLSESDHADLQRVRAECGITPGEVRAVHASVYASILRLFVEDHFLSHEEAERLAAVEDAMRRLGWTPGDLSRS